MFRLVIPGEPQGKQRPRWSRVGTYTPAKTVNYENFIKQLFVEEYPNFIPIEHELNLDLMIYCSIPKSTSKKRQKMMMLGSIRPAKRPDVDNVIKSVFDALEKLAYKNDSQFIQVNAHKYYSDRPRLVIKVY